MQRPSSSPAAARRGPLLPRINSNPTLTVGVQVPHERFWQAQLDVGVGSAQGYRPYHEDEFQVVAFLSPGQTPEPQPAEQPAETHFFAVFDGHAGGRCSKAIAATLADSIARDPAFHTKFPTAIKRGFHRANDMWFKLTEKQRFNDGTTAVCTILRESTLYAANVGDSRAILLRDRKAIQLTNDHKPMKLEEQRRIASFGGSVVNCMGVPRVNGVLAVSRAFGNRLLKDVIRADPDVVEQDIVAGDDFVVLGSDGLYDVLSNQDICNMCYELQSSSAQVIADHLVATALQRGSMDNVTAVVVDLRRYVARMSDRRTNNHQMTAYETKTNGVYPPLSVPKPGASISVGHGALAKSVDASTRLGASNYATKYEGAMHRSSKFAGIAARHTDPSGDAVSPSLCIAQTERSAVVSGGSTQRVFNLRSILPRQQIPRRPKTGARRPSLDRSIPLMASNGQPRPVSSSHSQASTARKARKNVLHVVQDSSPVLYRTV